MTVLLLLVGLVSVALPGVRLRVVDPEPRWFVRLTVVALLLGLACLGMALVLSMTIGALYAMTGASDSPGVHLAPEGGVGAVVAAGLLAVFASRAVSICVRARERNRCARAEGWLGEHRPDGSHDLVVLPIDRPVAYSVSGRCPQIVISQGLRQSLDDDVLEFVIGHERAHLRARHRRALVLATVVEGLLPSVPWATRSAAALRIAVERAADEEAAGTELGRRRRLALEIARMSGRLSVACGPDLVRFRANRLSTSPHNSPIGIGIAAVGLVAVALAALSALSHVSGDVSPYLALL